MSLNQFQCNRFSGPEDNAQKSAIHEFDIHPVLRRDAVFGVRGDGLTAVVNRQS